jgi:predicted DCC family thiol-disulfide oxidoreductase YuxK
VLSTELASAILDGGRRDGTTLTALFDQRCPLCRTLKAWLSGQPTLVPIEFLAAGGPEARRRYPQLDHARTTRVLTVVAGDGAVYEGERAWVVCAWALPGWQPLAERVGTRHRLPMVRLFARMVDRYRHHLIARPSATDCGTCNITAPRHG